MKRIGLRNAYPAVLGGVVGAVLVSYTLEHNHSWLSLLTLAVCAGVVSFLLWALFFRIVFIIAPGDNKAGRRPQA